MCRWFEPIWTHMSKIDYIVCKYCGKMSVNDVFCQYCKKPITKQDKKNAEQNVIIRVN